MYPKIILMVITIAFLITATVFDVKTKKIPNFITFPSIGLGLIYTAVFHTGDLLWNLAAILFLFFVSFPGIMGNGDIKLLMAVVAFNTWKIGLYTVTIACILLLAQYFIRHPVKAFKEICNTVKTFFLFRFKSIDNTKQKYPFAPYLLSGYVISYILVAFLEVRLYV